MMHKFDWRPVGRSNPLRPPTEAFEKLEMSYSSTSAIVRLNAMHAGPERRRCVIGAGATYQLWATKVPDDLVPIHARLDEAIE